MRSKLQWFLVIVVSIVLGGAIVVGVDALGSNNGNSTSGNAAAVQTPAAGGSSGTSNAAAASPNGASADVSDLYDQVRPSVVQITTQAADGGGLGSGVILDTQGDILTNNHVIDGASEIDVTLADGDAAIAQVVGTDPGNDIAVVKVNLPASELKPVTLGDSDKVRVGEGVIAVGNPFGIEGTLTEGIVSGIGRTLSSGSGRPLRQLIQSDAAINPGNSGGGLFDLSGNLIGITAAIENPSGEDVFAGIGYAVPINTATRFMPDLLAGKQILHPRLGIGLEDLTPSLATTLGLNVQQGVLVISVDPSSAAAKAGLQGGASTSSSNVGDVITAIDGHDTKNYDDLANYVDSKQVGDKVTLTLIRGGKQMNVDVTLDAWQQST